MIRICVIVERVTLFVMYLNKFFLQSSVHAKKVRIELDQFVIEYRLLLLMIEQLFPRS
jgi:hypothetical protein